MTHPITTGHGARRAALAGAAALTLLGLTPIAIAEATPPAPTGASSACAEQNTAMDTMQGEIAAHNAKPHHFELPREQAGFDAYNAEAADIRSRATSAQGNLNTCMLVALKLSGGPFASVAAPVPSGLTQLVKSGRYSGPNGQQDIEKLLETLDENAQEYDDAWAEAKLQDQPRPEPGDADPARPGQVVGTDEEGGPQVTPDYVIPLSEMLQMPKFLELNADSMWMVAMSPLNREWVSHQAAMSRRSPSVAAAAGTSDDWMLDQAELADQVRGQFEQLIEQLADSEPDDA